MTGAGDKPGTQCAHKWSDFPRQVEESHTCLASVAHKGPHFCTCGATEPVAGARCNCGNRDSYNAPRRGCPVHDKEIR